MPEKGSKKYTIVLPIATSLSVLILFVPLSSGLFDLVSVIGSTESNNTPKKRVSESQNGQTVREFTLIATENQSIEVMDGGYVFKAWTFNGTIPGPTMRVTEGDLVKITLVNDKNNARSHSVHMHSIHSGEMDGVEGKGIVAPGESFTYEFVAQPFGVYPYHCHVSPVADHISRGLYGMLIIDPKEPRTQMKELAMMMNGYDFNYDMEGPVAPPSMAEIRGEEEREEEEEEERDNEIYTV